MIVGETLRVAVYALRANKLRSFLTMLGIIIGVGAVITMVALGTGAQKSVQERIQSMGPDLLTIFPGQSFHGGIAQQNRVSLTVDDADSLKAAIGGHIRAVVPELSGNLQIQRGNTNLNVDVTGSTANYAEVKGFTVQAGQMFTEGDDEARRRYAVLGGSVPAMFDANPDGMIGQEIQIRGIPFTIVGVLAEKGSQGFRNPDEQVLIPLETARYRIFGTDRVRTLTVQVDKVTAIDAAMVEIERVLRREHRIRPGGENDFQIRSPADLLATLEDTTKTFTRLLAGIAAVSLLVGGIGIMNIMLVSVTERTREIGVRKAVGATRGNILFQFLVEALVLCLAGGVVGILVGAAGAEALARINKWNTQVSPFAIGLAFFFSALVGVLFGMWPARRAADLDPIVALRYE